MQWELTTTLTEWFRTPTGVRQGCILSPELFNIFLELVISLAIQDLSIGINLQGMTINNLRFADNIVLLADSVEDLQALVTNIHTVNRKFSLTINKGKTEVQWLPKTASLCPFTLMRKNWNKSRPSLTQGESSQKNQLALMTSKEWLA